MVTQEGTRPLLVEIQALVDTSHAPNAKRLSVGFGTKSIGNATMRFCIAMQVSPLLIKMFSLMRLVASKSLSPPQTWRCYWPSILRCENKPLPRGFVVFGEVGLAGEIRPAPRGQERFARSGKTRLFGGNDPKSNAPKQKIEGLHIIAVIVSMRLLTRYATSIA